LIEPIWFQFLSAVTVLDRQALLTLEELKAHALTTNNLLQQILVMLQDNGNNAELYNLPAAIVLPLHSVAEVENLEQHVHDPDIKAKWVRTNIFIISFCKKVITNNRYVMLMPWAFTLKS